MALGIWGYLTQFIDSDPHASGTIASSWRYVSPLHPYLRLAYIELHHVNVPEEIVVADSHVETLQRFLLLAMRKGNCEFSRHLLD